MSIGTRIKKIREEQGMSQRAFAQELGVTYSYISSLEQGKKTPSDLLLLALEYKFGINKKWIIQGKGAKQIEKPQLTKEEENLLKKYKSLKTASKKLIISLLDNLK